MILRNEEVFRESHTPQELPHREGEMEELQHVLYPATRDQPARNAMLSGPSGVGKTVAATVALGRLKQNAHVRTHHIRCLGKRAGTILRDAVHAHPRDPDVEVSQSTPVDDVADALREIASWPYVLVLDEADDVHETDLLDRLADIEYVSYIVICHNPQEFRAGLSKQALEALDWHVEFTPYSADSLADILEQRARLGLKPGSISRGVLEEITEHSDGAARKAIQTLYHAAVLADDEHRDEISSELLPHARQRARTAIRKSNLRSLPIGHLLLYHLVQSAEGEVVRAETLHERYDAVAGEALQESEVTPVTRKTRQRYLRKLEEYDLVGWEGENRGRKYFAMDPELEVPECAALSLSEPTP